MWCEGTFRVDVRMTAARQVSSQLKSLQKLSFGAAPIPPLEEIEKQVDRIADHYRSDPETMKQLEALRLTVTPTRMELSAFDVSDGWTIADRKTEDDKTYVFTMGPEERGAVWTAIADQDHFIFIECTNEVGEYAWRREPAAAT